MFHAVLIHFLWEIHKLENSLITIGFMAGMSLNYTTISTGQIQTEKVSYITIPHIPSLIFFYIFPEQNPKNLYEKINIPSYATRIDITCSQLYSTKQMYQNVANVKCYIKTSKMFHIVLIRFPWEMNWLENSLILDECR